MDAFGQHRMLCDKLKLCLLSTLGTVLCRWVLYKIGLTLVEYRNVNITLVGVNTFQSKYSHRANVEKSNVLRLSILAAFAFSRWHEYSSFDTLSAKYDLIAMQINFSEAILAIFATMHPD